VWFPQAIGSAAGGPFPVIVFAHGYLAPAAAYAGTLRHLAAHGFVVAAVDSERGPTPRHATLAADLNRCARWLAAGADGVPGLRHAVDHRRLGLCGHSMGGGCAILAAAANESVRSVSTLAAARTRSSPNSVEAAARLSIPSQFLAAERDRMTPMQIHQRPMFEAVPDGVPTQLRIVTGGSHSGFVDALGPVSGWPWHRPVLSHRDQLRVVRSLLTSWFQLTLAGRADLWDGVWGPAAAADPDVSLSIRSAPAAGSLTDG
jgi:dienelactone hydrolase